MSIPFRSLQELNKEAPDNDYPTTVCSLEADGVSADLRCWQTTSIPVHEIEDPGDPVNPEDPEDPWDYANDYSKIESLRAVLREGGSLPAVTVIHDLEDRVHPYGLMEGMHRYNAALHEGTAMIHAWVAHIDCCGGPARDL